MSILCLAVALAGCQAHTIPDPNDPPPGVPMKLDALQSNVKGIADLLMTHREKKEISNAQYHEMLSKAVGEILDTSKIEPIEPTNAWRYGELLRTADRWKEALPVFEQAVKFAETTKNNDRWVNDSLRLAQAQAMTGDSVKAIATARSVFGVPPRDAAPILIGVLLEIVPAARNQGHDLELAKLLEDAVLVSLKVEVDQKTNEGKLFLDARPYHIERAMAMIRELYGKAGKPEDAIAALQRINTAYSKIPG